MAKGFLGTHKRQRLPLLALGLIAVLAAYLVVGNPLVSATSGGDPYSVPVAVDTNSDPHILETTIVAEEATVEVGKDASGNPIMAHAQTFNGQIPGPTLELNVGDTAIVHFESHLAHQTGIHWHGIELANSMDGTPFTQNQVDPGGNFLYKFTVTRPGLFWYHPHHHASTDQVFKGLYGMIVVRDPNEAALQASGTLPPPSQTRPIVLSDTTVCKAVGSNDAKTYEETQPHVSGSVPLPTQGEPTPKTLCEGPGVKKANPYPIDENGSLRGPFEAGDIPNIQTAAHHGATNEGQTVLTDGKNVGGRAGGPCTPGGGCPPVTKPGSLAPGASLLDVRPGQGLRLEILNASAVRYMRLQLTTEEGALVPLIRVGGEGGLLDKAVEEGGTKGTWNTKYQTGEILMPPGSRADVVAAIPSAPASGVLTLWTEDYQRSGGGFTNVPTVPVMHLNLSGPPVVPAYTIAEGTPLRDATGDPVKILAAPKAGEELLNPATFTSPKEGMAAQTIELTQKSEVELSIDNVFGNHDFPGNYEDAPHLGSSRYAKEGDVLQLEVKNTTEAHHPFHLHGFSMQPISLVGTGKAAGQEYVWPYPEFRDNIDVPGEFILKFRVELDPRPQPDGKTPGGALGRWLFHCHIFFHATNGMLSELVVTAPDGNERPDVNVDNSQLEVTRGNTATVHGTYKDPDGDPVSLSSSVGKVTVNGSETYTWSLPATNADKTQIVYITATDSHGLTGQIPFYLQVKDGRVIPNPVNVAPVIRRLRVVPRRFLPAQANTKLKRATASRRRHAPRGATIKFKLSEAARMRFVVKRLRPHRPHVRAARFSRRYKAGGNKTLRFSARFKRRGPLPPGRYLLTARAVDAGGLSSKRASTRFTILP